MTEGTVTQNVRYALVRPPGASFANAISSGAAAIDVARAQVQHAEYCAALAAVGVTVEALPADERFPDSCFMQDPGVVIGGVAVVGRMGAASRGGEEDAVAERLGRDFPVYRLMAPATLEGGDVLILPDRLAIGLSGRTNRQGIEQLAAALRAHGDTRPVHAVPVPDTLHLLTALTYIGQDTLLVMEGFALPPVLRHLKVLTVPAAEAYAANVLAVGDRVILPAGYPHVTAQLCAAGFEPLPVPMTEFARADGGVTCLSLVW